MSYGQVSGHLSMVFDDHRNTIYRQALGQIIKPGTVVMDLGAGVGILGFLALAEGAERVVMVEPSTAIRGARIVADALGLTDRIDFVDTPVEQYNRAPVDCIVSVFTGNFLLEEDLLPSLFFARDHCLKPGGTLLPDLARMQVTPVSLPTFYEKYIDRWQAPSLGVDFSSLRSFAVNNTWSMTFEPDDGSLLGPTQDVCELDFATVYTAACDAGVEITITDSGLCHGLLGSFSARMGDDWLNTGPDAPKTHWSQLFLPLSQPISVKSGDVLVVSIRRPEFGEWSWSVVHNGRKQMQSTFLGNPTQPADILRKSDGFQPVLNPDGELARTLLARFDGQTSRGDLKALMAEEPGSLTRTQTDRLLDHLVSLFSRDS